MIVVKYYSKLMWYFFGAEVCLFVVYLLFVLASSRDYITVIRHMSNPSLKLFQVTSFVCDT